MNTCPVLIKLSGLLVIGQVDTHDRVLGGQQHTQPREPLVAVAITAGQCLPTPS
jgi:hypothetical protein